MENVEELGQDEVIKHLLNLIAEYRNGETVGITVVKTSRLGKVDMNVLATPSNQNLSLSA